MDAYSPAITSQFNSIGILGGSGPEAALSMSQSIVRQARKVLPKTLRGDQTAPLILLRSDPRLGASMNISHNRPYVLNALLEGLDALSKHCDHIIIACNTLNFFGTDPAIRRNYPKVLWFQDILSRKMALLAGKRFDIYGVNSVVCSPYLYSPYREMFCRAPDRVQGVDVSDIVAEIKRGRVKFARQQYRALLSRSSDHIAVLACTELALINSGATRRTHVIDMNTCVAEAIVLAARRPLGAA